MQNVTGGTAPLPPIRPPAAVDPAAVAPPAEAQAAGEVIATGPEPHRDTGIGTSGATSGARPSSLSLPGASRPRALDAAVEPEGAGGDQAELHIDTSNYVEGSATVWDVGSTSTGTSKGSTGSRGTRSV